jgi:hypothetical protein
MEHLERVLETLRELQVELLRKAAAETQEADRAAELAKRAQEGLVSEAARRAQDRQAELGRDTEKLARDFEALIPELLRNPSAPTSLLVNLEKIGRGVRSVALNPMAAMAGSLGKASQAEAGAQPQPLTEAQGFGREAAEQLEMLARIVERMQRLSILEKLATEAELLAARQREIKGQTLPVARKTAGSPIENLSQDLRSAVQRLAAMEKSIKSGVDLLGKNIEKAAGMLASSDPADAATAEQAGEKLESEKISERAERIAKKIGKNVLFSELPAQESVAESLEEVAKILRRESDADLIEAIIRELEEFIRRQKKINSDIELAIAKLRGARTSVAIGESQSRLGRDVSEHGSALYWLGQEIEGFRSESAEKLGAAANEMNLGAEDLYESSLPEGFEHGKKALALLEAAREKFDDELQELSDASQGTQLLEAMLLLQRILIAQKRINRQTAHADDTRLKDPAAFDRKVVALANRQGALRLDATRLREMLARFPDAAELVATAGDKMDESRSALAAGQTGGETRIVQRQIVAILEMLLGQCKQRMGEGLGSQRMIAMIQMMAGMQGGGFTGGTNAPILPASLNKTGEQDWRTVRSRFSEQLAAGHEEQYPVEYRDLLNAYFQRLRAEPAR